MRLPKSSRNLQEKETDPEKKELLKFEWGMDFGAPHEAALTNLYEKPLFRIWLSDSG